jgi:hypothetical protein
LRTVAATATFGKMGDSVTRKFVHPEEGDTLETIADRHFPGRSPERGVEELLSWNLHLVNRLVGPSTGVLGSDLVYLEPPLAS